MLGNFKKEPEMDLKSTKYSTICNMNIKNGRKIDKKLAKNGLKWIIKYHYLQTLCKKSLNNKIRIFLTCLQNSPIVS